MERSESTRPLTAFGKALGFAAKSLSVPSNSSGSMTQWPETRSITNNCAPRVRTRKRDGSNLVSPTTGKRTVIELSLVA